MTTKVLKAAVIGLGGFAHAHHDALRVLEANGEVQVVATCDPQVEKFAATPLLADLEARSVPIHTDYLEMLDVHANELDFVTIPTPIPLHATMHRACVERGMAVYLEKPPTLDWRELDSMIETEKEAHFQTQVGFNFIIETTRQSLKARILAGEFGDLKRAIFVGCHPRSESYFRRAHWAGRLRNNGHLILDSCVGNALAHQIHNLLFWCGESEVLSWGEIRSVEAELYRAHAIENFDTVFARGQCGQTNIWVGATHTGSGPAWQHEIVDCEHARIIYGGPTYQIHWHDGRQEENPTDTNTVSNILVRNLRYFAHYLRGEEVRPLTTLADSRPFVMLNDLILVAAGHITTLPNTLVDNQMGSREEVLRSVVEIQTSLQLFLEQGLFPSEMGTAWAIAGGRAQASQITQLDAVIESISTRSEAGTVN
ncbi:inositol 2-dehydrogenase/D-chiro-inositol 3-dehydrogenase [Abditibacteriota bacterium]|nr:inositol 2-dehydrogenase/D-chiro-inositol 3-dehydrogenase [Abditibacteriota bacterium]